MINIVIVFPKLEDGMAIKNVLVRNGYDVNAVCTSGAQVVNYIDEIDYGVVICGYKFNDMLYSQLYEYLSDDIEMLLVASRARLQESVGENILSVEMPFKVNDMINSLELIVNSVMAKRRRLRKKQEKRTPKEQNCIDEAKKLLMERNNMSEDEAHRYIQKHSMDTGTNMVETAQMVLQVMR